MSSDKKTCNKCLTQKSFDDFFINRNQCKDCVRSYKRDISKRYREQNKDKVKESSKKYRDQNIDKIKEYNEKNPEISKKANKKWRDSNKEKVKIISKNYYEKNKEKISVRNANYVNENKGKVLERLRTYYKEKRLTDNLYKLKISVRNLIRDKFRKNNFTKKSKTQDILGCTYLDLISHLESKFEPWMTWENYGLYNGELNYGWDIDHIIPISSAKSEQEVLTLNHFLNLQPLCSKINRDIKRNKLYEEVL